MNTIESPATIESPPENYHEGLDALVKEGIEELEKGELGDDSYFSLDELLAESLEQQHQRQEAEKRRKMLQKKSLDASTRKELEALQLKWEEGRVWITLAKVAVFHTVICEKCGRSSNHFSHWMLHQEHKSMRSFRFVRLTNETLHVTVRDSLVQKRVALQTRQAEMCMECAAGEGFNFEEPFVWEV